MMNEQQMQVRKLHEKQGIKPAAKQTSADARIAALEAKLRISFQPKEDNVNINEGATPKEPSWGRNRENPVVIYHTLGAECKKS